MLGGYSSHIWMISPPRGSIVTSRASVSSSDAVPPRPGILAISPHMPKGNSAKRWGRSVGLDAAPEQEAHKPDIASQSNTREPAQKS